MKGIFYCCLLVLSGWVGGFAQTTNLSGLITDAETNTAIEFADVMLMKLPDSVKTAVKATDEKGNYVFLDIPYGDYVLVAAQFGYHKTFSPAITLDSANKIYNLSLKNTALIGKEVTVTTRRSLVRVEEGKMIVDVENSLGNGGQTVIDVLRKSPGISVDQDGKIQLKGKSGVQVMLDDKVMYLSEEQLGNLLKSIPSDLIKEIEIITSPSAKYDAVGNGGIINIRLKKGAYEGLNGTANASYGSGIYHKAIVGVNVSYKKNRLSLNTGYQYNHKKNLDDLYGDRVDSDPAVADKRINSNTYYAIPFLSHTFTLSGEYKVSPRTSLTFDFNDSYSKYTWDGSTNTQLYKQDGSAGNSSYTHENGTEGITNYYSSLGFRHQLDTSGTVLSGYGAYNYNTDNEKKIQQIDYYNSLGQQSPFPYIFNYKNNEIANQYNGQVDLVKKFYKKIKFESGLKGVHYDDNKPIDLFITQNDTTQNTSNHFRYIENVYAAYAMASGTVGKFSLQAGLRLERTMVTGTMSIIDSTFKRDYTNLFPSGNITFKQSDKVSYTILYSRRITRPNAYQLNPVQTPVDPYTSIGGNPYILPQYADNAEFSYSIFDGVIITTLNYTYVKNPIVWAYRLQKATGVFLSGPTNLDYQENYGLSLSVNKEIRKWWTSNNNLLVNNNTFVGQTDFGPVNNTMNGWGVKSTQSLTLPQDFSVEISGMYDSPTSYAFSHSFEKWQANIAIQKKFWDKKATIKLAANDMFRTFRYAGTNDVGTISQASSYRWDNRTLILSFTYKFGNQLMKTE